MLIVDVDAKNGFGLLQLDVSATIWRGLRLRDVSSGRRVLRDTARHARSGLAMPEPSWEP
jgi:hypothetical protein